MLSSPYSLLPTWHKRMRGERVAADDMRQKKRAWLVAGNKWDFDEDLDFPIVLAANGQVPIVFLPKRWESDEQLCELAFGWAAAELVEQRGGWLFLVRRLVYFASHLGRIASAVAVSGGAIRLVAGAML